MIDFLKFALKESVPIFKVIGIAVAVVIYVLLLSFAAAAKNGPLVIGLVIGPLVPTWLVIMWGKYQRAQEAAAKAVADKLDDDRRSALASGVYAAIGQSAMAQAGVHPPSKLSNAQILANAKKGIGFPKP